MTASEESKQDWEIQNNPEFVNVRDTLMNGFDITVDVLLLVYPTYYTNVSENRRLRRLAIEQQVFKPFVEEGSQPKA